VSVAEVANLLLALAQFLLSLSALLSSVRARRAADRAQFSADQAQDKATEACREQLTFALRDAIHDERLSRLHSEIGFRDEAIAPVKIEVTNNA